MESALTKVERIVRKIGGVDRLSPTTRLFHDLSIAGDDALEVLEVVARTFGTSFEGFEFKDYFPEEGEALFSSWLRRFGMGRQRKHLTVGHLAEVAERGKWFEPATPR